MRKCESYKKRNAIAVLFSYSFAEKNLKTNQGGSKAIKAKGTYYPLTAFPTNMPQGPVMRKGDESPPCHEPSPGKTYSPILFLLINPI